MLIRFLVIIFIFAFSAAFAQATDGVRLNINLHPVQTLLIDNSLASSTAKKESSEYITVSSLSGFEIKVKSEPYNSNEESAQSNKCNNEFNLIDASRGAMHKKYKVKKSMESIMKTSGCNISPNNLLVFTIISQ